MSRIGKLPVKIPAGVNVKVENNRVEIKGPKGTLVREVNKELSVAVEGDKILVRPAMEGDKVKALWGLNRVLLFNMVEGVTQGYKKELEIVGVGYKAEVKGKELVLYVGMSAPYKYKIPEGIKITVENQTKIVVEGIDKEKVGQTAAEIRSIRPPEPYKGKGIKYVDEQIRRKAGKTAGK